MLFILQQNLFNNNLFDNKYNPCLNDGHFSSSNTKMVYPFCMLISFVFFYPIFDRTSTHHQVFHIKVSAGIMSGSSTNTLYLNGCCYQKSGLWCLILLLQMRITTLAGIQFVQKLSILVIIKVK